MSEPSTGRGPVGRWVDRLTVVGEDGARTISPAIPMVAGLAALVLFSLVMVSQCTVATVQNVGGSGQEPVPTVATPSFRPYVQDGCEEVDSGSVALINRHTVNPRHQVGQAQAYPRGQGQFLAVSIAWDNRMVEARSAIFSLDEGGELWSVSSSARELTDLPDGREVKAVSPGDAEALSAQNCLYGA